MRSYFGVDSRTKLIHVAVVTAANAADGSGLPELLHGDEMWGWGEKSYDGQHEVFPDVAAQDRTHDKDDHDRRRAVEQGTANRCNSTVRFKVKHPIGTTKHIFGRCKVCYRCTAKNANRLYSLTPLPTRTSCDDDSRRCGLPFPVTSQQLHKGHKRLSDLSKESTGVP